LLHFQAYAHRKSRAVDPRWVWFFFGMPYDVVDIETSVLPVPAQGIGGFVHFALSDGGNVVPQHIAVFGKQSRVG
jgi:hypothetical protein